MLSFEKNIECSVDVVTVIVSQLFPKSVDLAINPPPIANALSIAGSS